MKSSPIVPSSKKIKSRNCRSALKRWWTAERWPQLLCSWQPCQGMGHHTDKSKLSKFHFWLWFRSGMADLTWPAAKGYPLCPLTDFYLQHSTVICPFFKCLVGLLFFNFDFFLFALRDTWVQASWPLVCGRVSSVKSNPQESVPTPRLYLSFWHLWVQDRPLVFVAYWISISEPLQWCG